MDELNFNFWRDALARNSHDISSLKATVHELLATVKILHENQRNLNDLIESKIQHQSEIDHIKDLNRQTANDIHEIKNRLCKLEEYSQKMEGERTGRNNFIKGIQDYWKIFVIVITISICVVCFQEIKDYIFDGPVISKVISKP